MNLSKIYYVPGLISAILIPILFWFYGSQKLKEPTPNVMDFGLSKKLEPNEKITGMDFEYYRNWNYKKIVVQPNTARKNSNYYVSEIKKLQKRNQKNTGIEFIIGNDNSYDDLISILNDFEKAKQYQFGLDLDKTGHLFAVHIYEDPNAKKIDTFSICGGVIFEHYEPTLFEKITYQFSEFGKLPKPAYYIIFGYLILLNVSILSLVRKSI
ncbi:hypothetical protein [Cloacibacterium normanense]|uniref:hypothetical protein n=1 Tax=Cloacibacterium normanense TaxID=237258 RepID=UPI00391BB078